MTCSNIDEHQNEFGVKPICHTLAQAGIQIAPSTYYARRSRPPSARAQRDEVLAQEIQNVHASNYGVFGARKMHTVLNREADVHTRSHVARCTVERLMCELGLHGIRRAKAPNTTRSAPREQCPEDLVERHFSAFFPNQLWVADITYVYTFTGWVYVAFVTDVFNREIVGWQVSSSLPTGLALDALQMGVYLRKREGEDLSGLVHHSDRGVQGGFNWSSQHLDHGGVERWRRRTGPRRPATYQRERVGSGVQIGRCARRCAHRVALSPRGRCSADSGA